MGTGQVKLRFFACAACVGGSFSLLLAFLQIFLNSIRFDTICCPKFALPEHLHTHPSNRSQLSSTPTTSSSTASSSPTWSLARLLARSLGGSTPRSRGGRALKFDLDCEWFYTAIHTAGTVQWFTLYTVHCVLASLSSVSSLLLMVRSNYCELCVRGEWSVREIYSLSSRQNNWRLYLKQFALYVFINQIMKPK